MIFKALKTNELTFDEKKQICSLYKDVFGKEKTIENFIHEFEKNEFGYSYYGLMVDNNKIVGSYAVIPLKFNYFGKLLTFGQAVNTMIKEEYRGNPFNLRKMANAVYQIMKKDNIPFVYGFPNENIYLVRKKVLKWKDIYNLDIYLLPIKLDKINLFLKPFNIFNKYFIKLLNFQLFKNNNNIENFRIFKFNDVTFQKYRFTKEYKKIILENDSYVYYKAETFNNIITLFIVDIYPLTKSNLELAVKKLYEFEKNIDLIAYFGYLPFTPKNMFKIPNKLKPKNTHMAGKILDISQIDESIFNIKNWRVNLSNFDWI